MIYKKYEDIQGSSKFEEIHRNRIYRKFKKVDYREHE